MSGYIYVPHAAGHHLYTDGARFDRTGALLSPVQKVITIGHMPAALTVLGGFAWQLLLQQYLIRCEDLDSFLDTADATMKALFPSVEKAAAVEGGTAEFEMLITGYSSRRRRLGGWVLRNFGEESERWFPQEITEASLNPAASPATVDRLAPFDGWKLPRDAALLMQAQRETHAPHVFGASNAAVIGCFIQRTIVTKDGVSTGIVHRWPDVVGEIVRRTGSRPTSPPESG